MQRFKKILVHVNSTLAEQRALDRAARLAKRNDADLTIMDVMEEVPLYASAIMKTLLLEDKLEAVRQDRATRLDQLVVPIKESGVKVTTCLATGTPFLEIIRMVLHQQHDLVVKSIDTQDTLKQVFFGSTDMHLLRKCPVPLWLIKPTEPENYRRILVALDPGMENGVKLELGVMLLKLSTSLAKSEGAELLIVHAWKAFAEEKLKSKMEPEKFEEYVATWKQESMNRLWRFVSGFEPDISPECLQTIHGEPGFVIPKFAKEQSVDLVVMGTIGRTGIQGILIGNTAERILNQLECSVLTLKPKGFVSPLTVD